MSWLDNMKVETKEEKLLLKIDRNRQKAIDAQNKAIELAEKDDLKTKYSFGEQMTSAEKKVFKDFIKAIQTEIENPPIDDDYEPQIPAIGG